MQIGRIKYPKPLLLLASFQLLALFVYLNVNIVNVGEIGTALPLLAAYVGLSSLLFLCIWLKKKLYIRFHLMLFLLLIVWVAIRIIIDLGDMEYLKQITIATTGGMLLFYLLGAFLGLSYQSILTPSNRLFAVKFVIMLFASLMVWVLYNFSQRLHPHLFYLLDVDGSYQRSGNFLSILCIIFSFIYLQLVLKRIGQVVRIASCFFWLGVYTLSTFMALVSSQLFGSNSATAVILGVYLITLVMNLILPKKTIWLNYLKQRLALPWSKRLVKQLTLMPVVALALFVAHLVLIIRATGFDLTSLRLLGFGSGSNTSLLSRIEILLETGANQMSYSPFLGNINVAYLTTGDSGRTLHSFFPYVMANLGLVGLTIVLALFASVLMQLCHESSRVSGGCLYGYQSSMIALYSIFIFLYILFFANLATGVSWAVLWFTFGFISKPFGFSK
ncbi:hypothetical protein [Geoalkalibacter subterraneus]|uniref:hypothetical protein n=1 Tax=Geoalkalibacter subterraneus TaxID=483547 RepID=UPI000B063481|nr:hypothetical protein [Geoalkalibacter subterraneus]